MTEEIKYTCECFKDSKWNGFVLTKEFMRITNFQSMNIDKEELDKEGEYDPPMWICHYCGKFVSAECHDELERIYKSRTKQ